MNCKIIWLTGLSGSGKTTISKSLYKHFKKNKFKIYHIDGDNFRKKKYYEKSFTKKSITENNLLIINSIKKIMKKYDFIIVSVISPLKKTRIKAKKIFGSSYYEVFLNPSIKTLRLRDTKNLYSRADKGLIDNVIGYNSIISYEKSIYSKIAIDTGKSSVLNSRKIILNKIFDENK